MAEYKSTRGSNPAELLAAAVADAERAVKVDPSRREARLELARVFRQWGDDRQSRGEDPSAELRKAIAVSDGMAAEERDFDYHLNVGLIYQAWADYQDQTGVDGNENRGKAIDAGLRAIALNDRTAKVWLNLGINYYVRASAPGSAGAEEDLKRAEAALEKGRSIDPVHIVPYFYGGEIHLSLAQRKRDRGVDPGPDLALALSSYQGGLTVDPKLPQLYNGIGTVLFEQAALAWDRGARPDPLLEEAQAAFEKAISVAPDQGYGYHNAGEALARRAYYQRARGEDPTAAARAAVLLVEKAIERIPDSAAPWVNLGMIHATTAGYELMRGRDPTPALAKARAALDKALAQNPKEPEARVYQAEMRGIEARWKARRGGGDPGDFEAAARAFREGVDLAPERQSYALLFGRFCHAWGAWLKQSGRDPGPALSQGMGQVDRVLSSRPEWADARALRAGLLLAQAESAKAPEERRDLGRRAAEDFTRALSVNGSLEEEWGRYRKLAEQLAASGR